MPTHSTKSITRTLPVPSVVIQDVDLVSNVLPKGISANAVKSMDISQVGVSNLVPGRCKLTFIWWMLMKWIIYSHLTSLFYTKLYG